MAKFDNDETTKQENIFLYTFENYESCEIFEQYALVQTKSLFNKSDENTTFTSEMMDTIIKTAYIEGLEENSPKVKAFIDEINKKHKNSFEVAFSNTWYKGRDSSSLIATVPPNETTYLTTLAVGATSNGYWKYKKYSKNGSWLGYHYEPATGTAIKINSTYIIAF